MASGSSSSPFFGFKEEPVVRKPSAAATAGGAASSTDPTSSCAVLPLAKKKRRNQPGTPYPDAEVIALSPTSLLATNRFVCEVCNKGFQREQNLQLHRRGHNLPWKLRQKGTQEVRRRVYLCPEPTCVHHDPSRALGDLTGIKKHFCRKHGEKKWKCDKCSKRYAVQSDWKAHSKTCGTREYRCDCGTLFSRRDSFITHRAFCDALTQEVTALPAPLASMVNHPFEGVGNINLHLPLLNSQASSSLHTHNHPSSDNFHNTNHLFFDPTFRTLEPPAFFGPEETQFQSKPFHGLVQFPDNTASPAANAFNLGFFFNNSSNSQNTQLTMADQLSGISGNGNEKPIFHRSLMDRSPFYEASAQMSATALLQKASQMGATASGNVDPSSMRCIASSSSSSNGRQASLFNEGDNEAHFQDLMNSLVSEQDAVFGGFPTSMAMIAGERKAAEGGAEGLTRDFLGVGAVQLGPPMEDPSKGKGW